MSSSEYLVKEKYAARGKIALNGGSNGGLLVAACVNTKASYRILLCIVAVSEGFANLRHSLDPNDPFYCQIRHVR